MDYAQSTSDNRLDWRSHFPSQYTPRQVQADLLSKLTETWNQYDCHVISAPCGSGKSSIARTLLSMHYSANYLAPNNLLVKQFLTEYPDVGTLNRLDSYYCTYWKRPCVVTRVKLGNYCKRETNCIGCGTLKRDLQGAKYKEGPLATNYHIHMAHRLYRRVLVLDEAHNSIPIIQERLGKLIWQHELKYPNSMHSIESIQKWLTELPEFKLKYRKLQILREAVISANPKYVIQRTTELFNGKGTTRGKPESRDCIKLLPVDISDAKPILWKPGITEKLVLMSATISRKDITELGLHRNYPRIQYLECKSPIPAERRPVYITNWAPIVHHNLANPVFIRKLATELEAIVMQYPGERGVIHASYQLARLLRPHLTGSRYLWHSNTNKQEIYEQFRKGKSDAVLVASGMYEGIDLPGELGRFQVISKLPWKSLENPAIAHKAEQDEEWYLWDCAKSLIQACGRICRTESDWGDTIIIDSTFDNLYSKCMSKQLIPSWFSESLVYT